MENAKTCTMKLINKSSTLLLKEMGLPKTSDHKRTEKSTTYNSMVNQSVTTSTKSFLQEPKKRIVAKKSGLKIT